MHGRVKVRTSEEEKVRKEKERQEKLKVFKHAMQTIQSKRKQGELDKELLGLTGKVLTSNPDIYTLWNIRREVIIVLRQNQEPEQVSQLCDAELQLTEYCLKMNPKSYCAWHQRQWVLTTRPDPDWQRELDLCNTYLKLDERNFHTWDYRRFVVNQCKLPLEDEFKYTTEKLHDNFSNYSAWHHRSKMLVELYPDLEGGRPIEDSHHKHELRMVQSAAFTDPDDTSAWFYQRWLLGAVKKTVNLVVCAVSDTKTTVAYSDCVSRDFVKSRTHFYVNSDDIAVKGDWASVTGSQYDVLWIFVHDMTLSSDMEIKVCYQRDSGEEQVVPCVRMRNDCGTYIGKIKRDFQNKYSQPVIEELKNQLESCRQLLALEPDNRWTLLTTTVFLHCIDAKQYLEEVIANLQTLRTMDGLRAGYYDHLISKWIMEEQLSTDADNNLELKPTLCGKVTSLCHLQYYSHCTNVDLSNHNLSSNALPSLIMLQHCKKLNLENNQLTTLRGFPNLDLEQLNIKGNQLNLPELQLFRENNTKCKIIF